MGKFLSTPVGSFLKVFLSLFLADLLIRFKAQGSAIFTSTWEDWAALAGCSLIPVVINWLNPADPRYGVGKPPVADPGDPGPDVNEING